MFRKRLYELRIDMGLTQKQLADELGASKQNISDWENGKSETSFSMLIKISKYFNVSIEYLLGIED